MTSASDPSTRAPALAVPRLPLGTATLSEVERVAGGPSLRMSPIPRQRVVLSERSESKDDGSGAPGLPGGLHVLLTSPQADPAAQPAYQFKDEPHSSHQAILGQLGDGAGRRLLDVGAADGFLSSRLAEAGWRVTAIEGNPTLAAQARRWCETVIVADLNGELPELAGPFDAIVYGDVLEHLLDPERVCAALNRLLAIDGQVVMSMPNVAHLSVRLMLLFGRFEYASRGIMDRTHLHFFTLKRFCEFFQACGLRLERVIPVPAPLFLAVPQRFHGPWLRALHQLNALGARWWPTGLAYQFVGTGRRTDVA